MSEATPDIEIYLKRVPRESVIEWIESVFDVLETREKGATLQLSLRFDGEPLDCALVDDAARGGYSSVWFKQNRTPWDSDEACAREAFERFGQEVRCSKGGWQTGQEDEGAWLRFTDQGVFEVNWRT